MPQLYIFDTKTKEMFKKDTNADDSAAFPTPRYVHSVTFVDTSIVVKYRKLVGTDVVEMNASEKAAADAAELADKRGIKKKSIALEVKYFIEDLCPLHNQVTLQGLMTEASTASPVMTNRAAYIQTFIDWRALVIDVYYNASNAINAASTESAINSVGIDLTPFESGAPDPVKKFPEVTIENAKSILN